MSDASDVGSAKSRADAEIHVPPATVEYAGTDRRARDSVVGIVGLVIAVIASVAPANMLQLLVEHKRRQWAVYHSGVGSEGLLSILTDAGWWAMDGLAILLGLIGIYLGRKRFGVAAVAIGLASMATIMTLILGSPW